MTFPSDDRPLKIGYHRAEQGGNDAVLRFGERGMKRNEITTENGQQVQDRPLWLRPALEVWALAPATRMMDAVTPDGGPTSS